MCRDYVDMIGEKWLSDVIFTTVKSKTDISQIKKASNGDFQIKDLSRAVNTAETNEITVRAWEQRASARISTLVFCVDLNHVASLTACFREHGVDARFITSETPKQTRAQRLDAFKNCEYPILLNCGIFTEGTDIPNIDCVMLARPTKSRNLLVQMIGRGMRLFPGKKNCHVIDMVASLGVGVVTTPTLFGLDPNAMVEEANVQDMRSQKERKDLKGRQKNEENETNLTGAGPASSIHRSLTFTEYESVHDLLEDTSSDRHVRSISPLAWVAVNQDRAILSLQNRSYISIERQATNDRGSFSVQFTQKLAEGYKQAADIKSPYMRPREVAVTHTFEDAIHAADTFAIEKFPFKMISHNQRWRQAPATEGQLAFINKTRPTSSQLTEDMISKGSATDMIVKIRFGAKGRFRRMSAEKRQEERAIGKLRQEDAIREREVVRVGPTS